MKITLLNSTNEPEAFIGMAAGICYGKFETSTREQHIKRAAHCVNSGHLSTLRFAHAVFRIEGISRICATQILRSKHLDFLQRSQRYTEKQKTIYPPILLNYNNELSDDLDAMIDNLAMASDLAYAQAISEGVKKEDARFLLLQGAETELIVVGNFQAWIDFINLRETKEAQWEIRAVATEIREQLATIAPNIFGSGK
jgi:thymidylate synthase (FAD)